MLSSFQVTAGKLYLFTYTYNLASSVATETYPSGRVITTTYNSRNQPETTTGTLGTNQTSYNQGTSYWPHEAVWYYLYGNTLAPAYVYNSRLQVSNMFARFNNVESQVVWNYTPDWGTTDNNGTLRSA